MTDDFQDEVDLPWGPYGERLTYYDESFTFLTLDIVDAETVATTDAGWPTVLVGVQDETPVGVAIGHVTQLNDKPAEEIDIFVDTARDWWALVEFGSLDDAISGGRYETQGYDGYEVISCDRRSEGFALFNAYAEDRVTPIFEMDDDAAAFAIQRASNFETLDSIFKLDSYSGVIDRQKSLERRVLPREEWLANNSLTGIARDLSDDN